MGCLKIMVLLKDESIKNDEVRYVRKMKILFWNVHRNTKINSYLVSLVKDNAVDVLILAEYDDSKEELNDLLQRENIKLFAHGTFGCERIDVWSIYDDISLGKQEPYYSLQVIKGEYIICCVHMPSDLHGGNQDERHEIARMMVYNIGELEKEIGSEKSIIIGDFNEMPYERMCLYASGMHGLPVLTENDKNTRIVKNIEYRKFYNPMWNLLGDFNYPPGTYYLNAAKICSPMWYMFDQVIISKDVIPVFKKESLKIITSCSFSNLADAKGRPNEKISDHFPIICEIEND